MIEDTSSTEYSMCACDKYERREREERRDVCRCVMGGMMED